MSNNQADPITITGNSLDVFQQEYWVLLRLEKDLYTTYINHVVGAKVLSFADGAMLGLMDEARTRQFEIVQEIAKISAANVGQLKTKSEILLTYYSAEIGDAQSELVRSIALDLSTLPLRDGHPPAALIGARAPCTTALKTQKSKPRVTAAPTLREPGPTP